MPGVRSFKNTFLVLLEVQTCSSQLHAVKEKFVSDSIVDEV